jgi:hypothetical protein
MTVSCRTLDELQLAPQMATLPALSACIRAVCIALDIAHPDLLSRPSSTPLDSVALLLRIHLDECQQILGGYDALLFESYIGSDATPGDPDEQEDPGDPDDDIPF